MKLTVDLGPPKTWLEFMFIELRTKQGHKIALDGAVADGPQFNPNPFGAGPMMNMNHHENCDRFATRSTSAQALLNIRMGLFQCFDPEITEVIVNDCDQDVCLAWFLLNNRHLVINTVNPLINALVSIVDMQDTCGGTYPFPVDAQMTRRLQWIMQPYLTFRLSGGLTRRIPAEYKQIIEDVGHRIGLYLVGKAEEVDVTTDFVVLQGGKCCGQPFFMVSETSAEARSTFLANKIYAYVSMRGGPRVNGEPRTIYTISKMSPFIPFPLARIYEALQAEEEKAGGTWDDAWGGSDTIGGSPRVGGSRISPARICDILEGLK